jgi:hypothetical protein
MRNLALLAALLLQGWDGSAMINSATKAFEIRELVVYCLVAIAAFFSGCGGANHQERSV